MSTTTESKKTETIIPGLYCDILRKRYFARPLNDRGNRSEKTFDARSKGEAIEEFVKWKKDGATTESVYVKTLIAAYLTANAPGAKMAREKTDSFVAGEISRCKWLMDFFGNMKAHSVKFKHALEYHDWRVGKLTKKKVSGGTTVDLDLGTLSNVYQHGQRLDLVMFNPMTKRERFAGTPEHCRDHCCRSGDELHTVASALGGVLALQFLFECCSGCRTGEALSLRRDAKAGQPGHIRTEAGQRYLCISRLKQGDQDPFDYLLINPALSLVLASLDAHHGELKKASRWFFPGRDRTKDAVMDGCALSHALRRVTRNALPGRRLTSHGCRAFYVTWRRVQKIDLHQIGAEVGHRSGVGLLLSVYGRRIPAWAGEEFSPYPLKVPAFWSGLDLLTLVKIKPPSENVVSTSFYTSTNSNPRLLGSNGQHEMVSCDNSIVVSASDLQHTVTR